MAEAQAAAGALSGAARVFFAVALAALIGFIAYVGRGVIIPVVFAGFVSFQIFWLKQTIKHGPLVGRFLPNWLCYVFAFAAIGSLFIFVIDIVRDNAETLIAEVPLYEARLRDLSQEGLNYLRNNGLISPDFLGGVDEIRRNAIALINPLLSEIASSARTLTGGILTVLLYTIFILIERARIFHKINLLSPSSRGRRVVNETMADIGAMVRQYITVKTGSNLVTATLGYIVMRLVGVDFAGFWALLIFVLTFIPIIGAPIAIAAPVLLALVQPDGGFSKAILLLAILASVDQVMSSVVEPRFMGRSLNLSPLVILLSLAVWGSLWGFAGLLLAVPVTVTVMIILTQFPSTRPIAILLSDSGRIAPIKTPGLPPKVA
jgi:predicted PurR-regulated permease PerM